MSVKRFCADCRHYVPRIEGRCGHPELKSVVDGSPPFCYMEREVGGRCKPSARLFEPKPDRSLRKWWRFWE